MRKPLAPSRACKSSIFEIQSPFTDPNYPYRDEMQTSGIAQFLSLTNIRKLKRDPKFPVAKYVSIAKFNESPNTYILNGRSRRLRYYTIGILTTDNIFYYNKFRTVQTALTRKSIPLLYNIILRPYIFNENTRVVTTENIYNLRDPVEMLLSVMTYTTGIVTSKSTLAERCAYANHSYKCIPNSKNRVSDYNKSHMRTVIKGLLEYGAFAFVEKYPDIMSMVREYATTTAESWRFKAELTTIMGILYLQCRDLVPPRGCKSGAGDAESAEDAEIASLERTLSEKLEAGESV